MNNNYISVSEVNIYIKKLMENDFLLNKIFVKGEISNFKAHTSGHFYFTLKDDKSRISVVMFSSNASKIKWMPKDGMKVLLTGRISVYEVNGNYQVYADDMLEDGIGNLYIAYEELKKKLSKEGLFDKEHKKKIPRIPKKIGIITAPTGAAIRDILATIKRRFPICETILFPSLVQGDGAANDIAKKINIASRYNIDLLIVGRGGGSIEDLWPFNEEIVARAIYDCSVPVISAVGHEIDFVISDFVADLRAPTPTAAAELAVPDISTILDYINNAKNRSYTAINNNIYNYQLKLLKLNDSYALKKPLSIYEIKAQKLDNIVDRLNIFIKNNIDKYHIKLFEIKNNYILNNPNFLFKYNEQELNKLISKLEVLNPLNTLKRGYSITKKDNEIIGTIKNIKLNDKVTINLKDGSFESIVCGMGE